LTAFQVDQAVTIWIAHTTFCAAYVAVVVSARLRELDLSIEEAASRWLAAAGQTSGACAGLTADTVQMWEGACPR
jgi:ABC-type spermidine/putrescine transport system permease subunit II